MPPQVKRLIPDVVIVAALGLACLKFTFDLAAVFDLGLFDEALYLRLGLNWKNSGAALVPQWGPTYSIWYASLEKLFGPSAAYYWNARLLCLAIALSTYAVARVYSTAVIAALASFPVLISTANLAQWPKAGLFALSLFLFFWAMAARLANAGPRFLVSGLGIILATYARPEFVLLWPAWIGLAAWQLRQSPSKNESAKTVAWYCLAPIFASSLIYFWKAPWNGGRLWQAFSQHFAGNWTQWTHHGVNGWIYSPEVMESAMPGVQSVGGALIKFPALFFRHIFQNLSALPEPFLKAALMHEPLLLPGSVYRARSIEVLIFVGLMVAVLWFNRSKAAGLTKEIFYSQKWRNPHFWLLLTPLVPLAVNAVLIGPHLRYLIFITPLFWITVALLLNRFTSISKISPYALAVMVFAATPVVSSHWVTPGRPARTIQSMVETIKAIRFDETAAPHRIAGNFGSLNAYLGPGFKGCGDELNQVSKVVSQCEPAVILLSELPGAWRWKSDPILHQLRTNPAQLGFTEYKTRHGQSILVKTTALAPRRITSASN